MLFLRTAPFFLKSQGGICSMHSLRAPDNFLHEASPSAGSPKPSTGSSASSQQVQEKKTGGDPKRKDIGWPPLRKRGHQLISLNIDNQREIMKCLSCQTASYGHKRTKMNEEKSFPTGEFQLLNAEGNRTRKSSFFFSNPQ